MFSGGPHQQDVVVAAFARAPLSTEDALAIVPQDLESVTHWHRNRLQVFICRGWHRAAACDATNAALVTVAAGIGPAYTVAGIRSRQVAGGGRCGLKVDGFADVDASARQLRNFAIRLRPIPREDIRTIPRVRGGDQLGAGVVEGVDLDLRLERLRLRSAVSARSAER